MKSFGNDTEALSAVSKGDLKAYRYLFDEHFSDLCNFLMVYLHNRELSEEIALDLFVYVWEKRSSLSINSSFRGFLFAAAKNRAVSHFRKEQKRIFAPFQIEQVELQLPGESQHLLEHDELRQIIVAAVDSLPEKSRMIYRLAWEENLSQKEIAEKLGLSPKTVENHVGIALRKLRTYLKPYYDQIFLLWAASTYLN